MKANAPEKIYLSAIDLEEVGHLLTELNDRYDIEYIRTDAFIEKAAEYLSYHLDTSKIGVNYKFDFIEEFRNAMKL